MKTCTILGILLLVGCTFLSMKRVSCKEDFAGVWVYPDIPQEEMFVVRTLEKQIEYAEKGKYFYEFEIKWLNDCTYQAIYKGTNNPSPAVTEIGEITTIQILKINKSEMRYKTSFRDLTETGKMMKIGSIVD